MNTLDLVVNTSIRNSNLPFYDIHRILSTDYNESAIMFSFPRDPKKFKEIWDKVDFDGLFDPDGHKYIDSRDLNDIIEFLRIIVLISTFLKKKEPSLWMIAKDAVSTIRRVFDYSIPMVVNQYKRGEIKDKPLFKLGELRAFLEFLEHEDGHLRIIEYSGLTKKAYEWNDLNLNLTIAQLA